MHKILTTLLLFITVGSFAQLKVTASEFQKNLNEEFADSTNNKVNIAYVDIDSLQSNYDFYKQIKEDVEKKQSSSKNELVNLERKFQNRAKQLQEKAQTMTPQQQENAMQEMNKMQNDFQQRQQTIDNELMNFSNKMEKEFLIRIEDFLKDYNKDRKYSYILSYQPHFMFYKDTTLNITPDVIVGLNDLYSKEKK